MSIQEESEEGKETADLLRLLQGKECLVVESVKSILIFQNNNESEAVYTSHVLKDPSGRVVCPALYVYVCPICNNTGHQAHTVKHCPYNPEQIRKQTELAEIWRAYRETKPADRQTTSFQPLLSSSMYNSRLGSTPPSLSPPSSWPFCLNTMLLIALNVPLLL